MSRVIHIFDDVPMFPRKQRAPLIAADGRVGGRHVLGFDQDLVENTRIMSEGRLCDIYPSLADEPDPELLAAIDAAVDALPDELRDCVELCVFGSMSLRQAGEQLGIYHKTVGRRLRKALDLLAASPELQTLGEGK